jgi:hypothetical protein
MRIAGVLRVLPLHTPKNDDIPKSMREVIYPYETRNPKSSKSQEQRCVYAGFKGVFFDSLLLAY